MMNFAATVIAIIVVTTRSYSTAGRISFTSYYLILLNLSSHQDFK